MNHLEEARKQITFTGDKTKILSRNNIFLSVAFSLIAIAEQLEIANNQTFHIRSTTSPLGTTKTTVRREPQND